MNFDAVYLCLQNARYPTRVALVPQIGGLFARVGVPFQSRNVPITGRCSNVCALARAENYSSQVLKMLEDARPVFQVAAELRSAVLREVAELIGVKHEHIGALSALCRAWMQCINE